MPTLATITQHCFGSPSHGHQRRKRNKRNQNWKRRKTVLFVDNMILYIENPKDATRTLLELINQSGKIAGYKINTQKSLAFPSSNNERSERETTPLTITSKRIKFLGINLPKESKDLYPENYKTLMKTINDDTDRWRDILCSWIEKNQYCQNDHTSQGNL